MIEIVNNLYLGGASQLMTILSNIKQEDLIINCTSNINYKTDAKVIRIEVEDDCSNKAMDTMKRAFLQVIPQIDSELNNGNRVFVHCKMGQQRSCAVIAAYLMKKYKTTVNQTVEFIKNKKKDAFLWKENFAPALHWWYNYI